MKNTHSKMKLLAVKLSSLQRELFISKEILQSASREVDEMFNKKYFPEIPISQPEIQSGTQSMADPMKPPESKPDAEPSNTTNHHNPSSEEESHPTQGTTTVDPDVKNLFRQIALKVHPDKLTTMPPGPERDRKIEIFQKARQAMENNEIIILADIAIELDIEPPKLSIERLKEAENKISTIKKEINHIESTYVWKWFFCTDKEQKNSILEKLFELMYAKNSRP